MKLAWKEIKQNISKYILIESILVLLIFMVVFLSGLANGLGWAITAAIEKTDAEYFVLSTDAEKFISTSNIEKALLDQVASQTSDKVTYLNIKRSNVNTSTDAMKQDITYFAIDPNSFIAPKVISGRPLNNTDAEYPIILDDSFMEQGIKIGDEIIDANTGLKLSVVGFVHDAIYSHSPVGYINIETYNAINLIINPSYTEKYTALAIKGSDVNNININGLEVLDLNTVLENLPGYAAEQLTIKMILWVLVVISAAVLGVFFYVITIQKQRQFGILKAIGMKMTELASYIMSQVLILSVIGVVLGNLIAIGMSLLVPKSMPFALDIPSVIITSIVFVIISILTSLVSIKRVANVDPITIIGGNE